MVLKLPTRVGLVFAAALAALLTVLAVTLWTYQMAREDYRAVQEVHAPSVDAGRRMIQLAQDLFIEQTVFIDHPEDRGRIREMMVLHEAEWESLYQVAGRYAEQADEQALVAQIGAGYRALVRSGRDVRQAIADGRLDEARRLHREVARPAFWSLRADVERYHAFNREQIEALNAAAFARFERAGWFASGAALVGALAAGVLWWHASAAIVRPLRTLTQAMGALEDQRFIESHDPHAAHTVELAALQDGFNRMSRQLAEAKRQLIGTNATLEAEVATRTRDLREANTRLEALVAELRTLDQLKSRFMTVVSHELLTPINFIVGFGSALEDELMGPLTGPQREAVGKILIGADRLTRMVRNTLEYTQLEAGLLAVWPQAVAYPEVAEEALRAIAPALAARGQSVSVSWPPAPPTVWADPDRLRQILTELLDNASKFSPEGAALHLAVTDAGDMVTTEVRDPGVGMSAAALAQVFTPFYQADSSSTRVHGGMGLGLAIAQRLAARMGGSMLVASAPDQGTAIRFTLPGRAPAPRQDEPHRDAGAREA